MKANERLKIAGKELAKGNLGNAFKSLTSDLPITPASYRGSSDGTWLFGAGSGGEDIEFSYSSLKDGIKAYCNCAPVASIVNRKAQAHINGKTWVLNTTGKDAGKESLNPVAVKLRTLLSRPNAIQSWSEFEVQVKVFLHLFGYCPILQIKPVGFTAIDATALWILPPWLLEIEESKEVFINATGSLIKSIKLNYAGKATPINPEDVFFIKDFTISINSLVLPQSRLKSLSLPIKNIIGAFQSRHVLLKRRGALGILSNSGKDQVGMIPLDETEKENVQRELIRYGLAPDQWQVIVTSASLNWQQMGYPTKDLMLFEEIQDSTQALCDGLGYPFRLLSYYNSGALAGSDLDTFSKILYTSFIIPEAKSMYEQFNEMFQLSKYGLTLDKDFSAIPELQEDARKAAASRKTLNDALQIEFNNGLITLDDWLKKLGEDPLPNGLGQVRATDPKNSNVPLAVTIGVGGIQGLISVVTAQGMSQEARQATLEIVFGLKPEDAARMALADSANNSNNGN